MSGKNQHDWASLKQKLIEGLQNGDLKPADGWASAATYIGVNESTMRNAIKREWKVKTLEDLVESGMVEEASKRLGTDVKETQNMLDITYVGEHARTLEELIARCKIDTSVWECVNVYPNSWNSAMKIREGDTERIVVVPLYQVKATFRRINPRPIMPMFQPLEVVFPKAARPTSAPKREGGLRRALIVPDPQIGFRRRLHNHTLDPFHDRQVLDLAVQIARAEGVDSMEFIGDWLDLSEFSTRWTPEPEFYWTTMPALPMGCGPWMNWNSRPACLWNG